MPEHLNKEWRSLLGLCGHYRDYVFNCADVADPLTALARQEVPNEIPRGQEAQEKFNSLQMTLCQALAMNTSDPHQPYWLFTDASTTKAKACLAQRLADVKEKLIAFAGHRFNPAQERSSKIEREAFVIIEALKKFHYWLFVAVVNAVSNLNMLSHLTTSLPQGGKLARWALSLQRYDVKAPDF